MEPSNFHSTVLARPPGMYDEDDDHRRRQRDILNPPAPSPAGPGSGGSSSTAAGPRPPFSLRSPTQSEFHHPPSHHHYSASSNASGSQSSFNGTNSSVPQQPQSHSNNPHSHSRHSSSSVLHSPFQQAPAASRPAHSLEPHRSPQTPGLQAPQRSPGLQAPPGYYSQDIREHHHPPPPKQTDKPASSGRSFYDPLTDTTTTSTLDRERRPSDAGSSWHNATTNAASNSTHRDPYGNYSKATTTQSPYYGNGSYTSPTAPTYPPRSPVPHPQSVNTITAGSTSPSSRPPRMATPNILNPTTSNSMAAMSQAESPAPKIAVPTATPSRAAELMSFSNILSSSEPAPKPRPRSPAPAETPVRHPEPEVEIKDESTKDLSPAPADADETIESPACLEKPVEVEGETELDAEMNDDLDTVDGVDELDKQEPPTKRDKSPKAEKVTRRPRAEKEKKERAPKAPRKSTGAKGRASEVKAESTPKQSRRSSGKAETLSASRVPAKRQANGQPKHKALALEQEKAILAEMEQLDEDAIDESEVKTEKRAFKKRRIERQKALEMASSDKLDLIPSLRDEAVNRLCRRNDFSEEMVLKLGVHIALGRLRYGDHHYDAALKEVREQELFAEKERKKDMQRKRRREKSMAVTIEQKEAALAKAHATEDKLERQKLLREAERANKKAQQTKLILQKGIKGPARNISAMDLNLEGGTMATFSADGMEPGKGKGKGRAGSRPKKSKEQKQAEKEAAEAAQAALDAGQELPSKEENPKIRIKVNKSKLSKDKDRDVDVETLDGDNQETKDSEEPPAAKKKGKVVEPVLDSLETRFLSKGYNQIYDQIWRDMARKDVSKVYRLATESYYIKASNLKKTAILAAKEAKRWQLRTNKGMKDLQARAKRVMRDMMTFWKRNEREERDLRKAAERQELENARKEEADREAARQKRKLNFLISQTELYSHFIGKKMKTDEVERSTDRPEVAAEEQKNKPADAKALIVKEPTGPVGAKVTNFEDLDFDAEDDETLQAAAMANAQNAIAEAQRKARNFNTDDEPDEDGEMNFQNPTGLGDVEIEQPKLLTATLKEYQLKGLNWLVNLYEQGINGILADEMGLGKTIQSISVMAYLAEHHDIWGPFLVVAPASTLHNWEQEIKRFVPALKIVPYWGSAADRKILRKFWDRKHSTYRRDAQFHVAITSYQMVVSDVAYFQKMKWQYMILDEAQAIKSSQSSRWKCLLSFHCRNRLLLTGTPIQNNMQELWALLHFIMPSLFDSHEEFSDWFSKDIESHAQSNSKLNEDQLKRLHMILKPFMLRRVKKHVQKELGDKIELDVFCDLTYRQRAYYASLRNQISFMDLLEKATLGDDNDSGTLMNLVMQFRKVCNHPDLFERADTSSPFALAKFAETGSFAREGPNLTVGYTTRSAVEYELPRLVWRDGGRLNKAGSDNSSAGFRSQYLGELMNIWSPKNVRESLAGGDSFSWLRFADTSMSEAEKAGKVDVFARAAEVAQQRNRLANMRVVYDDEEENRFTPAHALFQIRQRQDRAVLVDVTSEGVLRNLMDVSRVMYEEANLPRMDQAARARASAPPVELVCHTASASVERERLLFNVPMRKTLYGPDVDEQKSFVLHKVPARQLPPAPLLPKPDNEKQRFTNITVPSMRQFITNSGKLAKLDSLLFKLKAGGHRVLLYFQMTRMIDLMEEYLTYRNWKYCRLDGSTKLEDRRDTVHDFQNNPSIFIFLLSTRAGGLGINLTSADTVIFYDSDWNPTIDSQAMDRAHRLGQTRQVTVYRLITRGTIEERIRKRAMQKEEVQRVVITGGAGASSGVDFSGRRAPENRNRDIAMWLADDDQAELIERRERELLESGEYDKVAKKRGGGKRKKAPKDAGGDGGGVSLDEMYHEGEGNFDDNKQSGTATPIVPDVADAKPGKKKKATGKKAKTTKQRLAIADGQMDM